MRQINVSTAVFARIWSLRLEGEENENSILERVLSGIGLSSERGGAGDVHLVGLYDHRYGIMFPEGFQIERFYLGKNYRAIVNGGQWILDGVSGRYSRLNELSRVIGTKTENAWANWFFTDERGRRMPVSNLRDRNSIASRRKKSARHERTESSSKNLGQRRWCDDVKEALSNLGGRAPLAKIYEEVERLRRENERSVPKHLDAIVRRELEARSSDSEIFNGEDWFSMAEGKGSGIWALREH
jgi:hypothetical protein